jgi:hypothetical protein
LVKSHADVACVEKTAARGEDETWKAEEFEISGWDAG